MKWLAVLTIALLFPGLAWAVPSVSGINVSSMAHNASVVISGSSFGSKSTAAPLVWEDHEDNSFDAWFSYTGDLTIVSGAGTNQRHSSSTYNVHWDPGISGFDGHYTGANTSYQTWFVQYWFRVASNWDWGTTDYSGSNRWLANVKFFRMWDSGSTPENMLMTMEGWGSDIHWAVEADDGSAGYFLNYKTVFTRDTWHLAQIEYEDESTLGADDGTIRVWIDGSLELNETGVSTRTNDDVYKRPKVIGWDNVWGESSGESKESPNDWWMDDVYADNTWARVEIGDNATYANCTHREIQIPTAWAASEITITVNQGSFADAATAYLFVVDSDGNVNATGLTVTMGSGGGAVNSPPVITSNAGLTATVDQAYSYQATATDADDDTLTWSLTVNPSGMSVGSSTGLVSWTPNSGQTGNNNVTLQVSDGEDTDTEVWVIDVASAGEAEAKNITATGSVSFIGGLNFQ